MSLSEWDRINELVRRWKQWREKNKNVCWLCLHEIVGERVSWHHWFPKSYVARHQRRRFKVPTHPGCHKRLHAEELPVHFVSLTKFRATWWPRNFGHGIYATEEIQLAA